MAPPIWAVLLLGLSVLPRSCLSEPVHDAFTEGQKQEKVPLLLLLKSGNQDSDKTPVGPTGLPAHSWALDFTADTQEASKKSDSFTSPDPAGTFFPKLESCLEPRRGADQREEAGCVETPSAEQTHQLAEAMMEFTLDLFDKILQKSSSPNVVLSPLSVALALYHLELGARSKTAQQLQKVLRVESVSCLHQTLSSMRQELGGTAALRMAARMYLEKGFPVKQEFLEQSERFFGAKPSFLKGDEKEDLQIINQWVKEATEGKIENFLSELPANTVMLLLNAVYFQGFWKTKFDPSLTKTDAFHLDEKYIVPAVMMKAKNYPLRWFLLDQGDVQVAQFPFKNNMSFVTVVPSQFEWNISQLLGNLSRAALHRPFLKERPTVVTMPKLQLDHQMDLASTLGQLGLGELFQAPDLRGISEKSPVVSSVRHRATLELDEAGVEASGVTSVMMSRMSHFSVNMNRPFLFFIFDDVTRLPLFVGSVKNPNPGGQKEVKEQRDAPDNKDFLWSQKYSPMTDKFFGPNWKFSSPQEEDDYPEFQNPK